MNKYERWELLEEYYDNAVWTPGMADFHSLPDDFMLKMESSPEFILYKIKNEIKVVIKLFSDIWRGKK